MIKILNLKRRLENLKFNSLFFIGRLGYEVFSYKYSFTNLIFKFLLYFAIEKVIYFSFF